MEYKAEVGHKVRSLDFPGRDDCYVEGTVIAIQKHPHHGYDCVVIEAETEVWGGESKPSTKTIYPPQNGTPTTMGEITCGITPVAS